MSTQLPPQTVPERPTPFPRPHGHNHELLEEMNEASKLLRSMAPAAWEGFSQLHAGAMSPGVLSAATKELIALSIAVTSQCDGCIATHARAAARAGATPQAVAEALGVTLLMAGGPATVYAPRAWEAYLEFASPSMQAAAGVGWVQPAM